MTDDIVTQLREHQDPWYPLDEAADEIERLREELAKFRGLSISMARAMRGASAVAHIDDQSLYSWNSSLQLFDEIF
jgi:hypothetical protein